MTSINRAPCSSSTWPLRSPINHLVLRLLHLLNTVQHHRRELPPKQFYGGRLIFSLAEFIYNELMFRSFQSYTLSVFYLFYGCICFFFFSFLLCNRLIGIVVKSDFNGLGRVGRAFTVETGPHSETVYRLSDSLSPTHYVMHYIPHRVDVMYTFICNV